MLIGEGGQLSLSSSKAQHMKLKQGVLIADIKASGHRHTNYSKMTGSSFAGSGSGPTSPKPIQKHGSDLS
jgi:hypothetical protein